MRIPVIGISGYRDAGEHLITNYSDAILEAGGAPVIIPTTTDDDVLESIVGTLDGVLMTGGVDFDPMYNFGEEPVRELGATDPRRDEFDLKLLRSAVSRGIPVLGVCRGHQLMAVAFGGSLWQDLPSQVEGAYIKHRQTGTPATYGTHSISIEEGSFLEKVFGGRRAVVNSLHHQAIHEIPQGFKIIARSADGIIEGIERTAPLQGYPDGGGSIFSVQFHPEILVKGNDKTSLGIFRKLVDDARK